MSKSLGIIFGVRSAVLWTAAVLLLVVAGCLAAYQVYYAGRIFPGVRVGGVDVGGQKPEQASRLLQQTWDEVAERGFTLAVGENRVTLPPLVTSAADPDLTYELVRFSAADTAQAAYQVGRHGNWLGSLFGPPLYFIAGAKVDPVMEVNITQVLSYLKEQVPNLEQPPQSAQFVVDEAGNIQVTPGVSGEMVETTALAQSLKQAAFGVVRLVPVQLRPVPPEFTELDLAPLVTRARALLTSETLTFTWEAEQWNVEPVVWHRWLGAEQILGQISPTLSSTLAAVFFADVRKIIDQEPQDARFELKNGKVEAFQGSAQGRQVDLVATLRAATAAIEQRSSLVVPVVVATSDPSVPTGAVNDLGIEELIGVGKSNFAGSPKNRRHNIKNGASWLNGIIIPVGTEFSLIKTLGSIDAASGYLQELVIKGNRTIPEFGGGLCQIGTTTFRAALASGLPILERRSHSYRVPYYEPAGTDATIYDPKPDLRFKNDTPGAILIQTKIDGDNLIFEFWGKRDGRVAEQTKPRVFNLVAPPPTKLVETEDLEPGKKKCTERAHVGADAEFTYAVSYANGEKKSEVFKSHYVPWQEVCLIGVPKGTLNPEAAAAASGESTLPSADTAGQAGTLNQ